MEPTIWYGDSKITITIVFQVQNNGSTMGRTEAGLLRQHCVWERARCKCGPPLRSPLSLSSKWSPLGCNPLSPSRGWMMLSCLSNATMKQVLVNVPLILLGVFIWFPLHCWRGLLIIDKVVLIKDLKQQQPILYTLQPWSWLWILKVLCALSSFCTARPTQLNFAELLRQAMM